MASRLKKSAKKLIKITQLEFKFCDDRRKTRGKKDGLSKRVLRQHPQSSS